jgi:hypothetical protein
VTEDALPGRRWLLIISGALAWLFGIMLIFNTRAFEAPVGIDVTDKVATIAQAQGAILLGLGVINWMARSLTDPRGLAAILAGNLVVQLASLAVAARATLLGIFPVQAAPALVIHTILGAAFAWYLVKTRRG